MKNRKILKTFILITLILTLAVILSLFIYVGIVVNSVKNIDVSLNANNNLPIEIYDKNNNLIDTSDITINNANIDQINEYTKNAFISIEDKNFYSHKGLNFKRIAKALINNVKSKSIKEGASTISQQLIKNKYLSNEKTISRKIKEAYLTLKLEQNANKDKILENYLNTIYFGNGAYGITDASKLYFNKEVQDLTLSESAVLAGLIKSPANYSPINNYDKSIKRRDLVLSEMLEDKKITHNEYQNAKNEKLIFSDDYYKTNIDLYKLNVLDEASKILNKNKNEIISGGYKIYTYQDLELQKILDNKINDEQYYHKNSFGNIADSLSIIIDNNTHGVCAISGKSKYDLLNLKRQPGSLIKPVFVYAPAFEEKLIYPCSKILDEPIDYDGYTPQNVGNTYYGHVSIRDSIAKSLNIPAVKLCKDVGLNKCKNYATMSGIEFDKADNGYALALGGMYNGVTLKSITDAYSPFLNNGSYIKSGFIKEIKDCKDNVVYSSIMTTLQVYNDETAYIMTESMVYATKYGTSKKLKDLNFDVAGKTGTVAVKNSNLNRDAYSLAYTTDYIMSVWLGNYTNNFEYNLEALNNGGTYATEIIRDVFKEIYLNKKPDDFEVPDTIVKRNIDNKTYEEDNIVVIGDDIPDRYKKLEIFSINNLPKIKSTKFTVIEKFDPNIECKKNHVEISFDAKDYIEYTVYRKNTNNEKLISKILNKNNVVKIIDEDIEFNKKYSYYIIAKSKYSNSEYKSQEFYIYIEKDFKNLIDNNNITNSHDLSWLFA